MKTPIARNQLVFTAQEIANTLFEKRFSDGFWKLETFCNFKEECIKAHKAQLQFCGALLLKSYFNKLIKITDPNRQILPPVSFDPEKPAGFILSIPDKEFAKKFEFPIIKLSKFIDSDRFRNLYYRVYIQQLEQLAKSNPELLDSRKTIIQTTFSDNQIPQQLEL